MVPGCEDHVRPELLGQDLRGFDRRARVLELYVVVLIVDVVARVRQEPGHPFRLPLRGQLSEAGDEGREASARAGPGALVVRAEGVAVVVAHLLEQRIRRIDDVVHVVDVDELDGDLGGETGATTTCALLTRGKRRPRNSRDRIDGDMSVRMLDFS